MIRFRFGGRRRTKGGSLVVLAFVVVLAGWKFFAEPAMIKAEEWSGTIVSKETGKPFFSSRRHRRMHYYLTVDCSGKEREIEVTSELYTQAQKGHRAVKVKGELYPRLR
jgi:hypothetical protein